MKFCSLFRDWLVQWVVLFPIIRCELWFNIQESPLFGFCCWLLSVLSFTVTVSGGLPGPLCLISFCPFNFHQSISVTSDYAVSFFFTVTLPQQCVSSTYLRRFYLHLFSIIYRYYLNLYISVLFPNIFYLLSLAQCLVQSISLIHILNK